MNNFNYLKFKKKIPKPKRPHFTYKIDKVNLTLTQAKNIFIFFQNVQ